ncbi:SCO family protein [Candidatus Bealeia paramacronuclearis]|uniref:SCO family protein n=1 Tax=Candidatus Bealeia paramacronuclearis TaxID=1921001 RepID=A0ABZ2C1I4_9PROT|nr:SCO family protein [Candidatus Bealeia paramacronuclearis]
MSPTGKNALIAFVIIAGVTGMAALGILKSHEPKVQAGASWEGPSQDLGKGPVIGGVFHLVDQNGHPKTEKDFLGKPTLLYFGYTFCPDICPMALGNLTQLLDGVGADKLNVAFITIDPERDTVSQLKTYSSNFHPSIVLMTGTSTQTQEALKAYHVYAAKVKDPGMTDYVMDHSSIIYVMDGQGKYVKSFNHKSSATEMKAALKDVIR